MMDEQHVFVVDDDPGVRDSIRMLLESVPLTVVSFPSAKSFLNDAAEKNGCLVADIRMPDMSGLELQEEIIRREMSLPVIIITGHGDVPLAVQAMKAGAVDFIEKPFDDNRIVASIGHALELGSRARNRTAEAKVAKSLLLQLTPRERSVLDRLIRGRSNKVAAHELGISPRTIEIHRAHIMDKMKAMNLSDLVRIALAAQV
ncbi:MAG TPA: response regulator FixJ [Rhizomicrobium sp.]|jgi:two-component system response regulator FixJ